MARYAWFASWCHPPSVIVYASLTLCIRSIIDFYVKESHAPPKEVKILRMDGLYHVKWIIKIPDGLIRLICMLKKWAQCQAAG